MKLTAEYWIAKNCKFASEPWETHSDNWAYSQLPEPELRDQDYVAWYDKYGSQLRELKRQWDSSMERAMSHGHATYEDAKKRRYRGYGGEEKLQLLPPVLYHVTTAKEAASQKLLTRLELSQDGGTGLGGGTSTTLSFTDDITIARGIKEALIEGKRVAAGQISLQDMINQATSGEGADKPWINEWFNYYFNQENAKGRGKIPKLIMNVMNGIKTDVSFPKTIEERNKEDGLGWVPTREFHNNHYIDWQRKLTPQEIQDETFQMYKSFAAFRERAGGKLDPLFFSSNVGELAKVPEENIAILQFKPKAGAQGFQVSALGEWRTWAGDCLQFVGEVK